MMEKVKTCQGAVVAAQVRGHAYLQVPGVNGNHHGKAGFRAAARELAVILATKLSL